ncbi:glycosyltransferase family 2 protein [Actibacterium sp. MT2.3-13A]|uniref:glycosyltransferase family 2 protein n=1 Tax=Actibacterium sp. MT2.3-13A TaxID=2828332 RepID=UPI001BA516A4|nr:glycosyltransferase family 2 protein [Actibacterium sp. MT2.3-13A]
MTYEGLEAFLDRGKAALANGPVAVIMAEDLVEVDTTIRHHLNIGFRTLVLLAPAELELTDDLAARVERVNMDVHREGVLVQAVNRVIDAAPGQWLYYCYNAEYLFYPFCESRTVGEMLAFHAEERRDAMLTYVIDLYASDLGTFPNAVSLETALLDRSGYYALARPDPDNHDHPKERQLDFFGGLRWRFEEHVPEDRRKIDRISLFRARPGLRLRPNHTFNDEEYNTYACPWHHNLTAAVCSFRTAKALKLNPGSTFDIPSFRWHNSVEFDWTSRQLLDLGLMEPGQWV